MSPRSESLLEVGAGVAPEQEPARAGVAPEREPAGGGVCTVPGDSGQMSRNQGLGSCRGHMGGEYDLPDLFLTLQDVT